MSDPSRPTILQVLPKLDIGGVERVVVEMTEILARVGCRVIVASAGGRLSGAIERAGGEIVRLPLDSKSPLTMRRNAGRLASLIRAEQVKLVHAHSRAPAWSARQASRRTNVKFVTTWHGTYSENMPFKRRYNAVMASGDRIIAVSHFIADMIRERHHLVKDRLRVIHGGVDAGFFDPATVSAERMARLARAWALPDGVPSIMLPARLTSWKGQALLLDALPLVSRRDAVCVLVGSNQGRDDYTKALLERARALSIADRVYLVGHCEDMPAAMMLADVVVNASTRPEAFGRTIIEAQSMARLVVAADHGGAVETIEQGQTGWRFAPGDKVALARAIDDALALPVEQRLAFGAAARDYVSARFSIAAMQEKMLDVYRELLG